MTIPTSDLVAKLRALSDDLMALAPWARGTIKEAADEIERLQVETEGIWQDMLITQDRMIDAEERLEKLLKVTRSVLSEEGVKEYLCAYVMGVELIQMVDGL